MEFADENPDTGLEQAQKRGWVKRVSIISIQKYIVSRRHRGRDRMIVGFTTTYAISTYHH